MEHHMIVRPWPGKGIILLREDILIARSEPVAPLSITYMDHLIGEELYIRHGPMDDQLSYSPHHHGGHNDQSRNQLWSRWYDDTNGISFPSWDIGDRSMLKHMR